MRVTPIAVASILLCTAMPIEMRPWTSWSAVLAPADFAANLLLYAPLGWGLRHRRIAVPAVLAGVLSLAVEILQGGMVGRYSAAFDTVANVSGAVVGFLASRGSASRTSIGPVAFTPEPGHVAVACLLLCLILANWFAPGRPSDLSSWEDEYPLLLGNERTGERPWHGTIHELTIVPARLRDADLQRMAAPPGAAPDSSAAPQGTWRLPHEVGFIGGNAWIAPASVSAAFIAAARKTGEFSVLVTLTPGSDHQSGPARFVSVSNGLFLRNFDLGQEGHSVMFRVRTPVSGKNGMAPHTSTDAVLSAGRKTVITATYDGSISRIHVDGELHGRTNLAAASCMAPSLCDADLPAALGAAGALIALISLGYLRTTGAIVIGTALGGLGALLLYYAATLMNGLPYFDWAPLWSFVGAAAIGLSCHMQAPNRKLPAPGRLGPREP